MKIGKRFIGLAIGLVYAVLLGFYSMLLTGGGHGNFVWMVFFFFTLFGGLFYPAMGFLVPDLDAISSKVAFATIFSIHLIFVGIFFVKGMAASNSTEKDFSWNREPALVVVNAALFSVPQLICVVMFIKSIFQNRETNHMP